MIFTIGIICLAIGVLLGYMVGNERGYNVGSNASKIAVRPAAPAATPATPAATPRKVVVTARKVVRAKGKKISKGKTSRKA